MLPYYSIKKNYYLQGSSKGARGLSVPLIKLGIFTYYSISLDYNWRQWGSRYTIHAGRNLPANEFRYLRTVRVTAAVYSGLKNKHYLYLLTFKNWAGVRLYTSLLNLAKSCVFDKQSPPPFYRYFKSPPSS